jgi:hypothetical protein
MGTNLPMPKKFFFGLPWSMAFENGKKIEVSEIRMLSGRDGWSKSDL